MGCETLIERIASFDSFDALIAKLDELNLAWGLVREFGDDSFSQPSVAPRGILVDVTECFCAIPAGKAGIFPFRPSQTGSGTSM